MLTQMANLTSILPKLATNEIDPVQYEPLDYPMLVTEVIPEEVLKQLSKIADQTILLTVKFVTPQGQL